MKKWIPFGLLTFALSNSAQARDFDQYIGSYHDENAAKTAELPFAIFFKETVTMAANAQPYAHYVFTRSKNPLISPEQALHDAWASQNVSDFYVDGAGEIFQFYSFGFYSAPEKSVDFASRPARPGYACEWQRATGVSENQLTLDYCGDAAPKDVFTFGNGTVGLKHSDKVDVGIIQLPKTIFKQTWTKISN